MSPIQWQLAPGMADGKSEHSSPGTDVWFGLSMALIGFLVGMVMTKLLIIPSL